MPPTAVVTGSGRCAPRRARLWSRWLSSVLWVTHNGMQTAVDALHLRRRHATPPNWRFRRGRHACRGSADPPTRAGVSVGRARELGAVLSRFPSTVLIEDDHAGPVTSSGYHTLTAGLRHWTVIRSVSKFLNPDLRLSLVTGDSLTTGRVEGRQLLASGWVSFVLQRLVTEVWSDDATRRLLKRAAKSYDERRRALIDALSDHGVPTWGRSGLNIWIPVQEESLAVRNLLQLGIAVAAGEVFRLGSPPAVRVTTADLPISQAPELAERIALALRPPGRRTRRS